MKLKEQDLADWRRNPVTEYVIAALRERVQQHEAALKAAYWAGQARPDAERIAAQLLADVIEDIGGASLDDFRVFMESGEHEERERHQADGIHGSGEAEGG